MWKHRTRIRLVHVYILWYRCDFVLGGSVAFEWSATLLLLPTVVQHQALFCDCVLLERGLTVRYWLEHNTAVESMGVVEGCRCRALVSIHASSIFVSLKLGHVLACIDTR